ncbi:Biopolymer transport protein exbB [Rickettsiales bacterium Ac37b]|nr:Biopolymer transport protein exbB [Rickettsiales bacterium Ac37b]
MNETIIKTTEIAGNISATDVSIFGLINNADMVVKLVILLLCLSSLWSWSIIFNKLSMFFTLKNKTVKFEKLFWSGQLLENLYIRLKNRSDHPLANIFIAVMLEWNRPIKGIVVAHSIKERITKIMDLICDREMEKIEQGLNILAIIGSSAPFLGLFGTVWGIMHSFQSIAASKNTTLAVVAPGIAEALLATAIGLFAAIPALLFYNVLSNKTNLFYNKMLDFSSELSLILSREFDQEAK